MLQGDINNSYNQRMLSIAVALLVGFLLIFGIADWEYSLWGPLTVGGLAGMGIIYIGVALYRKWY